MNYDKMPSDFILATWKMNHTAMLTALRTELVGKGHKVKLEGQNQFYLRGSGDITVSGTPDLIGFDENDQATIYDTKTGKPGQADVAQVMIYMWALPYAIADYKGRRFDGVVVYGDHRVPIPNHAIDDNFRTNIANLIRRIGGADQAEKIPSGRECGFCELTPADCPDKIQNGNGHSKQTQAF
jgi:hypothetical protein